MTTKFHCAKLTLFPPGEPVHGVNVDRLRKLEYGSLLEAATTVEKPVLFHRPGEGEWALIDIHTKGLTTVEFLRSEESVRKWIEYRLHRNELDEHDPIDFRVTDSTLWGLTGPDDSIFPMPEDGIWVIMNRYDREHLRVVRPDDEADGDDFEMPSMVDIDSLIEQLLGSDGLVPA